MKKYYFLIAAAALSLASCSQTEVIEVPGSKAINFTTFVGNASRADITTDNLDAFKVYGGYKLTGGNYVEVFNGDDVTGTSGAWTYSPLRYWVVDGVYKFGAANAEATYSYDNDNLTVNYTVEDGEDDLLTAVNTTEFTGKETDNSTVPFNFKHALSKVQFTFKSEFDSQYTVEVTNVKLAGVLSAGTATATETAVTWAAQATAKEYSYADVTMDMSDAAVVNGVYTAAPVQNNLLPQTLGTVELTFTVTVKDFPVDVPTKNITVVLPKTAPETTVSEWLAGYVYNYNLTLTAGNVFELEPIEFGETTVAGWTTPTETDLTPETVWE